MSFVFNPHAEEFVSKAEEEYRHSGERDGCSLGRGEVGHRVGNKHPDSEDASIGVGMGWDG